MANEIDIDWIDKESTEMRLQRRKEAAKNQFVFVLFSLIGALVSVGSFVLYHYFSAYVFLTVLICVADIVYAYFDARLFLKSRDWQGVRGVVFTFFLIIYYGIVFGLVALVCSNGLNIPVSQEYLLYTLFLTPAFVVVILALALAAIIIFILLMLLLYLLSYV